MAHPWRGGIGLTRADDELLDEQEFRRVTAPEPSRPAVPSTSEVPSLCRAVGGQCLTWVFGAECPACRSPRVV